MEQSPKIWKKNEIVEDQKNDRNYTEHTVIKIDWNTEKSPGNLWRLAGTQTSVKDHQVSLVLKTHKKGEKKNKCTNTSSDKRMRCHTKKAWTDKAREKLNLFQKAAQTMP